MPLDGYYGEAQIVTEHGAMLVWADLKVERDEHSGRRSWSGAVDNRLRGPIHPVRDCPAILRMPDGREGNVYVGEIRLRVDEPVAWPVTGDGPAPFDGQQEARRPRGDAALSVPEPGASALEIRA